MINNYKTGISVLIVLLVVANIPDMNNYATRLPVLFISIICGGLYAICQPKIRPLTVIIAIVVLVVFLFITFFYHSSFVPKLYNVYSYILLFISLVVTLGYVIKSVMQTIKT